MNGQPREAVGMCLMKSDEADGALTLELPEVAAFLGRSLSMDPFLVTLSAYFGEIHVDDAVLRKSPVAAAEGDGLRR